MKKEVLEKAKRLEEDIRLMETALGYYNNRRWHSWGANDTSSTFHFAFHKHYGEGSAYREDLPCWLNTPLMEVVEREMNRCKAELDSLGEEKPSAARGIMESMKDLGNAINNMEVTVSDNVSGLRGPQPAPVGYFEHEEAMKRIPVFKSIGRFRRLMLRWCFGLKYIKDYANTDN